MEITLLGTVSLWTARGEVPLGPPQQRCVFAALALTPRQPVPAETLIDRLWGDRLPRQARNVLQTNVSRLRVSLAQAGGQLRRRDGGYLLDVEPDRVDLHHARRLAADARALGSDAADGERAWRLLVAACARWRGAPLAGLKGHWVEQVRNGLDLERQAMFIDRFEEELRLGRHADAVAPLSAEHAAYPFSEPLAALLMLALYRSGRQADALEVYARTRQRMIEDLGDEPGTQLRQLHGQVLRRDPALERHPGATGAGGPATDGGPRQVVAPAVPAQLPPSSALFTGRATHLTQLDALLAGESGSGPPGPWTFAIDGMVGVGKTALGVHAAHRVADRFPDGQLFIDLRGFTRAVEPGEALDRMLRALAVPGERIPVELDDRAGLWRTILAGRRMLVVLDDAATEAQVLPLLPGAPGCLVLVTSRHRLAGLEATARVSLDLLPQAEAVTLFTRAAGEQRLATEPPELLAEAVELCGRLPLAVRIAAARLRSHSAWGVADLVERLRDHRHRLAELADGQRGVAAALDLSYRQLSVAEQRMYRLLGLHPGPDIDPHAAAALADVRLLPARRLVDRLHDVHLLQEPVAGRYTLHDLVRAHAGEVVARDEAEADRRAASARLLDHYRRTAAVAMDVAYPHERDRRPVVPAVGSPTPDLSAPGRAGGWLDAELPNLLAAARHAAEAGWPEHTWQLSTILHCHLRFQGRSQDALAIHRQALTAARTAGSRTGERDALIRIGYFHRVEGRYEQSVAHFRQGWEIARATGGSAGEVDALVGLGFIDLAQGRHEQAIDQLGRALEIARAAAYHTGELDALLSLGCVHLAQGRLEQAVDRLQPGLEIARATGNVIGELNALACLGYAHRVQGSCGQAVDLYRRALGIARATGSRAAELGALRGLGHVYRMQNRHEQAIDHLERALGIARATSNHIDILGALRGLGDVHLQQGSHQQALDHYQQVLDHTRRIGARNWEFEAVYGLGRAHRAAGHPDLALAYLREALTLATDLVQPADQARAHDGLAHAHRAGQRPGAARHHWQQALDILTSLGTDHTEDEHINAPAIRAHIADLDRQPEPPGRGSS